MNSRYKITGLQDPWGRGTAIVVEGGCRLWRHIKLTVKGDIFPPERQRTQPFYTTCGAAAPSFLICGVSRHHNPQPLKGKRLTMICASLCSFKSCSLCTAKPLSNLRTLRPMGPVKPTNPFTAPWTTNLLHNLRRQAHPFFNLPRSGHHNPQRRSRCQI